MSVMIARVNIVVEGPTEVGFVRDVLGPHLMPKGVFPVARAVLTSSRRGAIHRGGVTNYARIHRDVLKWCLQDPRATVTSMLDLYGLPGDFPRWQEGLSAGDIYARVTLLEEGFGESVNCRNFIPYVQMHEFEALLFAKIEALESFYPECGDALRELKSETDLLANPEAINDRPEHAPSKRILKAVPRYKKRAAGSLAALHIGLDQIRRRCRHFDAWLSKLESLAATA